MDKLLKMYQIYVDEKGKEQIGSFPPNGTQIEIFDFTYSASRMGIPNLSATVKYPKCLDGLWTYREYVEFRGEKYWVSQKPSSSKDNTDQRYVHQINFIPERGVLAHTYFYDTVNTLTDDISVGNKYCSHSTTVLFYGTIQEFIDRINASLDYAGLGTANGGLGYYAVIDAIQIEPDKLETTKEFSCESQFILDVLSQANETWDIPFYFMGKEIHFGYYSNDLTSEILEYGVDKQLLKIERTNANTKIITRATGLGSADNIPHYYPNDSEKGNFEIVEQPGSTELELSNSNTLALSLTDGETYTYTETTEQPSVTLADTFNVRLTDAATGETGTTCKVGDAIPVTSENELHDITFTFNVNDFPTNIRFSFTGHIIEGDEEKNRITINDASLIALYDSSNNLIRQWNGNYSEIETNIIKGLDVGSYTLKARHIAVYSKTYDDLFGLPYNYTIDSVSLVSTTENTERTFAWIPSDSENNRSFKSLRSVGVVYDETQSDEGSQVSIKITDFLPYQEKLMPSIYSRGVAFDGTLMVDTLGTERYYEAINGVYGVNFENEFKPYNRSENIYTHDDIKPEIKNVTNEDGEYIDEIIGVAYDDDDNDSTLGELGIGSEDNETNYAHPYFYIKLRKFNGQLGFNLFDYAIADSPMTIQIVSGNLNGCKFKVQVVEPTTNVFKNPVQVDENGEIVAGGREQKIDTGYYQPQQQDTKNNEVWLAVLKDQDTFGVLMPNVANNYRLQVGDKFNITGINLPKAYILAAEQKLDDAIVNDMKEDNTETFNYSIDFSRIFLVENHKQKGSESWISKLNESSKVRIQYNESIVDQFISSYTYECKADSLPQINVELASHITNVETLSENIVNAVTKSVAKQNIRTTKNIIADSNLATTKSTNTKANKSTSLAGYGIEDVFIDDSGMITIGNKTVKPAVGDIASLEARIAELESKLETNV